MNMMEKKNMSKFSKKIKQKYNESGKNSLAVYLLLRLLVIICAVSQFWLGNINNTFLCFLRILFKQPAQKFAFAYSNSISNHQLFFS